MGGKKEVSKVVTEWELTGYSSKEVDGGEHLTNDMNLVIQTLNDNGYEVIAVMPIPSG